MTTRSALQLERFLPYRLNVAAETVSRALSRIYAERHGIGIPEWRVIATLGQFGTMTAKAIGAHSRMHKTKVSRAVALLERRALVARRANPDDKREEILSLTAKGAGVYRELAPKALAFEEALIERLGGRDARRLRELLIQLEKRVGELGNGRASVERQEPARRPGKLRTGG